MDVLLLTVWHTGTKYFIKGLQDHYKKNGRAAYSHLNGAWASKVERADIVFTTYRDPLRVAASWANRLHFNNTGTSKWMEQWSIYSQVQKTEPKILCVDNGIEQHGITFPKRAINAHPDALNLHEALNNGDMDYFYRRVPKFAVEHAIQCSQWAKNETAR
jgi:hypothetical protein